MTKDWQNYEWQDDEWRIMEPFDIDQGELDGLTPQHVFCLGVEYGQIRQKIKKGKPFNDVILVENVNRIKAMASRHDMGFRFGWVHDDHEEWRWIEVF